MDATIIYKWIGFIFGVSSFVFVYVCYRCRLHNAKRRDERAELEEEIQEEHRIHSIPFNAVYAQNDAQDNNGRRRRGQQQPVPVAERRRAAAELYFERIRLVRDDLVSALRDRDSQPPATPPPPNYTLVSGLPSYDEALKEARMISKEDENHDYVIWIEKVERQRKISEEHLPTVFHIFNQSQQEETISEETTANQSAAEHVATVIETPNEYCTAHI